MIKGSVLFVLLLLVLVTVGGYLDRPTVEVSVDTGACVRAYGPNGPMSCEEAMRGSYEKVIVDPIGYKVTRV